MHNLQLLLRPDLGKKAYRLRCRFRIGAFPKAEFLQKAKIKAAERFVDDMHVRGFEYLDAHGFVMKGPFTPWPEPITIRRPPRLTARQMLPMLMQGKKFRAEETTLGTNVLPLSEYEYWEYELAGVFVHRTILVEHPSEGEKV